MRNWCIACLVLSCGCATSMRRDNMLEPKEPGPRLSALAFIGPGFRGGIDHRHDFEPKVSQLHVRLQGDLNPAFADASLHASVRFMIVELGGGAGIRYGWHTLAFQPDPGGLDHGEPELNRRARYLKDGDLDFYGDPWPWAEGRGRVALPMGEHLFGITGATFRYEDRDDQTFGWELGTVYDRGVTINWETMLFLRHRSIGFVGPTVRLLDLPRGEERRNDFHYGLTGGTAPGWTDDEHALFFRVYTNAGFDDGLMGTHLFRIPLQAIVGYQQDFSL